MTLRAYGFCSLRFVLLARSIARLTGFISDQTLSYFSTVVAAGTFAIGVGRQRSLVDDALPRNYPG